jgi:hypothetical protein
MKTSVMKCGLVVVAAVAAVWTSGDGHRGQQPTHPPSPGGNPQAPATGVSVKDITSTLLDAALKR